MNKKFNLSQFIQNSIAFGFTSALGVNSWLYLAGQSGIIKTYPGLYLVGPVVVWAIASIPISISLLERISQNIRPAAIQPVGIDNSRSIPWIRNGQSTTLLASTVRFVVGNHDPVPNRLIGWRVPDQSGNVIIVYPNELERFLEQAARRGKYQFSRRYWTEFRRPALSRLKYDAYMRLLHEAGLIGGRQTGASGFLVTKPHYAITYLKNESRYKL